MSSFFQRRTSLMVYITPLLLRFLTLIYDGQGYPPNPQYVQGGYTQQRPSASIPNPSYVNAIDPGMSSNRSGGTTYSSYGHQQQQHHMQAQGGQGQYPPASMSQSQYFTTQQQQQLQASMYGNTSSTSSSSTPSSSTTTTTPYPAQFQQHQISHQHRLGQSISTGPMLGGGTTTVTIPPGSPPGVERYACTACSKTFSRAHDRKRHFETSHDPNPPNHRCHFCGKSFARADSLKRHLDNGCDKDPKRVHP
ncbi:hypothetical protein ABKN59_009615 [Abortiporus biennis]